MSYDIYQNKTKPEHKHYNYFLFFFISILQCFSMYGFLAGCMEPNGCQLDSNIIVGTKFVHPFHNTFETLHAHSLLCYMFFVSLDFYFVFLVSCVQFCSPFVLLLFYWFPLVISIHRCVLSYFVSLSVYIAAFMPCHNYKKSSLSNHSHVLIWYSRKFF